MTARPDNPRAATKSDSFPSMRNLFEPMARWCLLALLQLAAVVPASAAEFLPPKLAYKYTTAIDAGRLLVRYEIADDYYLYRDRLGFETTTPGVQLRAPEMPVGLDHEDDYFGKQVIYRGVTVVGVPVTFAGAPRDFDLKLKLQGCADAGLCYPPQNWQVRIVWPQGSAQASRQGIRAAESAGTAPLTPAAPAASAPSGSGVRVAQVARRWRQIGRRFPAGRPGVRFVGDEPRARSRTAALGHRRRVLPVPRQGQGHDARHPVCNWARRRSAAGRPSTTSTLASRWFSTMKCGQTCRSSRVPASPKYRSRSPTKAAPMQAFAIPR